eukprot:GHUV01038580.1.p1 GENE.GHUV01038580.1~~GHUV01038580.1.p1  ORF type:complete len:101 (-),score=25.45 GHUV01038580.1:135-437(-)
MSRGLVTYVCSLFCVGSLVQAITAWRDGTGFSRVNLVKQYFQCVEGFTEPEVVQEVQLPQGGLQGLLSILPKPLQQIAGRAGQDPFHAVIAYRNFKSEHA